jgi:hypothetical protein
MDKFSIKGAVGICGMSQQWRGSGKADASEMEKYSFRWESRLLA